MLVSVRIGMTIGGDVRGRPSSPAEVVADARRAEDEGFATAWSVHFSRAVDALTALAVAGPRPRGSSSVSASCRPTRGTRSRWPSRRPPRRRSAAAGSRSASACRTGPSSRGCTACPTSRPAAHMREYLSVLGPLLRGEEVHVRGRALPGRRRVRGARRRPVSVLVGALSPRMVRVAGRARRRGDHLAGRTPHPGGDRPAAAGAAGRAARRGRRSRSRCTTTRRPPGRRRDLFARYNGLENYRRLFEREGVASVGALAVVGTEAEVSSSCSASPTAGHRPVARALPRSGTTADREPAPHRRPAGGPGRVDRAATPTSWSRPGSPSRWPTHRCCTTG